VEEEKEQNKWMIFLRSSKEMWIIEDEFHPCGGVVAEPYP
jgi:hypothetical protein